MGCLRRITLGRKIDKVRTEVERIEVMFSNLKLTDVDKLGFGEMKMISRK